MPLLDNKMLRFFINSIPEAVFWKDTQQTYLGGNQSFLQLLGLSDMGQLIGKKDTELACTEDRKKYFSQFDKEVLESQESYLSIIGHIDTEDALLSLSTNKYPLYNDSQQIIGVTGICYIDDGSKTASLQTYLENIIASVPCYIFWKNIHSVYLGCNEQFSRLLGKTPQEIIGKTDFELGWKEQEAHIFIQGDKEVFDGNDKINLEEILIDSDGSKKTMLVNKAVVKNKDHKPIGILGVSFDITKRKQMEKELHDAKLTAEQASKAKSEFIANMSHDIRTPLAGILGLMRDMIQQANAKETLLLTENTEKAPYFLPLQQLVTKVQDDGRLLLSAAEELLQLLNEILETMRLDSGKEVAKEESFSLPEIMQHNIDLLQPVAHHKNLILSFTMDEHIPTHVIGLRNYLDRSLLNLLTNALKFTKEGEVKLQATLLSKKQASYQPQDKILVEIVVQDTGMGIPADKFTTIFEHFSCLNPSSQGLYKGTGLGLYNVKQYMQSMHAEIHLQSTVGKGSSFTLSIPFLVSSPPVEKIESSEVPIAFSHKNPSILIVEDSNLAARALAISLEQIGNIAMTFTISGKEALQKLQEQDYDLIFMDIGLPDINGIDLAKEIRNLPHPKKATLPIIALTGYAHSPTKTEQALQAGVQQVLAKPLSLQDLKTVLASYVYAKS